MTPDLDEIRRVLAAASKTSGAMRSRNEHTDARMVLIGNAPTWLAALVDEIERQQAQLDSQARSITKRAAIRRLILKERKEWKHAAKLERERHLNWEARWEEVRAERDAALARVSRLQAEREADFMNLKAERDAALTEIERWKASHQSANDELEAALAECERLRNAYDVPL